MRTAKFEIAVARHGKGSRVVMDGNDISSSLYGFDLRSHVGDVSTMALHVQAVEMTAVGEAIPIWFLPPLIADVLDCATRLIKEPTDENIEAARAALASVRWRS